MSQLDLTKRTVFGRTPNGRDVVSYGPGLWFVELAGTNVQSEPVVLRSERVSIHRAAKLCAGYDSREFLRGGERFAHFARLAEAPPTIRNGDTVVLARPQRLDA